MTWTVVATMNEIVSLVIGKRQSHKTVLVLFESEKWRKVIVETCDLFHIFTASG